MGVYLEDAIDRFIDDAAVQHQLRAAGCDVIMNDGCDFERIAGEHFKGPRPLPADCDHVKNMRYAAHHHHDECDGEECEDWPYESPFDDSSEEEAEEVDADIEEYEEDEFDDELTDDELFDDELEALDCLEDVDGEDEGYEDDYDDGDASYDDGDDFDAVELSEEKVPKEVTK